MMGNYALPIPSLPLTRCQDKDTVERQQKLGAYLVTGL